MTQTVGLGLDSAPFTRVEEIFQDSTALALYSVVENYMDYEKLDDELKKIEEDRIDEDLEKFLVAILRCHYKKYNTFNYNTFDGRKTTLPAILASKAPTLVNTLMKKLNLKGSINIGFSELESYIVNNSQL